MCFKPKDVPSKKVVLVELERAKVILEQENSALKVKLKDLQASTVRAAKERDGLICQRAELEAQLQQRASHASHLLTHITCLRTNLAPKLQELLHQHLVGTAQAVEDKRPNADVATATKVNVHVAPHEDIDDVKLCDTQESAPGDNAGRTRKVCGPALTQIGHMGQPGLPPPESADSVNVDRTGAPLSVQQQLDSELEALTRTHQGIIDQATQLCDYLRQADSDKAELRADVAGVRRRLEQAEANAADQQLVLQLRCAALEQENEQLTGMNQELQERLEAAQGELSSAKKQWSSDGAQLAKQTAELQATSVRLSEVEAELRVLQSQLVAATVQAEDANATVIELQQEIAVRASSLNATGSTLATRETELAVVTAQLQELRTQLLEQQLAREALAAELTQAKESGKLAADALNDAHSQLTDAQQEWAAAQRDLAATQRDLAAARRDLELQSQALLDSNMHLQESRTALAATSERLSRALDDVAANEKRVTEANALYLSTKQSVISTAKQLASMAKDHSANLAKLHALEAEATSLRDQLAAARSAEATLRAQVDSNSTAARESREAAEVAGEEVRRLRAAYDTASADLRRKIMLLTAIARMADKGPAGAGGGRSRDGQAADPADGYGAVTSEQRLRLKICESPLPLLGALTAGIMDSSRLRHLALDMDTSREVTWEKAGLRICCLAAAIGLNNSLQTLQLGGWTWGELGNGTALPFLALGGGGGGGVAGGMLRSVQLATNLFDLEAAAMLKDLLAAGLVELAAAPDGPEDHGGQRTSNGDSGGGGGGGGGQGVLYLYSGNERLDGWYREMLVLAGRRPQGRISSSGGGGGSAGAGSNGNILATIGTPMPSGAGPVSRSSGPSSAGSARLTAPFTNGISATSIVLSGASGIPDGDVSVSLSAGTAATATSNGAVATAAAVVTVAAATITNTGAATATAAVDCDLSSEALESHHMVLVMTVLLTCPGMKRLRLDGNKLGDGGAALLALGLSTNTGLRELYLSRNGIRAAGARSLARCLEGANSTLLRLDLSGQRLEGIGAAGAEAMAQALRTNRTLEDLNLSSCGLSGSAAACFAGAIRVAGAVRSQSPSSMGGALPLSSSSLSLTAAGGGVSPRGGGSGGGCLRRLILSGNGIDAATVKALMGAAAERPGLALAL
ncbi:hypothetical protein VaNZ11_005050 [Volvox africanus]|uniref:Uncharacterized protein n=1 Tax=Volvox africanus TaxID=51714 RepID=A0ABQ5RXV2_9CHLO|nr:hypothetical protein VaNZ11_005050 [Volvox africanus]